MKNRVIILVLAFLGLTFQECSNEFELTDNWKDVTVVYGLLDASDTAQYIRVEKAFLDKTTSALVGAQVADSLFYENITVQLQEIPQGGGTGLFHILERVDANEEGFQKEDGIFATSPNYVYKLDRPIVPSASYRLTISKEDGSDDISAQTGVIGDFTITFPNNTISTYYFQFKSNQSQFFRWTEDDDAGFYDLVLRIHFTEAPVGDPTDKTLKTLDWKIASNLKPSETNSGNLMIYELEDGADFYKFLQANLDENPIIVRELSHFDVLVYAGGVELLNYVDAGKATSGITSAETFPSYTNINGGLGLFSTRYVQSETNFPFRAFMKDTLRLGPYTQNLGFQ